MGGYETETVTSSSRRSWWLWLRVLGVVVLGMFALLSVTLAALAGDDQSPAPIGFYAVWLLVLIAVVLGTYAVLRNSAPSKRRALLTAFVVVTGSYGLAAIVVVPVALYIL